MRNVLLGDVNFGDAILVHAIRWDTFLRTPCGDFGYVAGGTTLESIISHTVHSGVHQPHIAEMLSPPLRSLWPFKVPHPSDNPAVFKTANCVPRIARELHQCTCGRSQLGGEEREEEEEEEEGGEKGEEGRHISFL